MGSFAKSVAHISRGFTERQKQKAGDWRQQAVLVRVRTNSIGVIIYLYQAIKVATRHAAGRKRWTALRVRNDHPTYERRGNGLGERGIRGMRSQDVQGKDKYDIKG
ncbi:uncharacterized protein PGTG_03486 [Puccinia graminis f. sp. tritici CRL 75-36-700-3]|uniref:Uncharacterized protein n=1 Tax=Puccinia graminis f. sp. tritici (strain CRL 75-36-700-3 / race SCCL) TaxID=418459 RepID=E3JZQ5_PUCGT|nr:uncharacterized protein PGTG_03486 [Puccinia graminis f. sp. tritici CRL 75-36-700-3]EFP77530.1 hypothetical protein PGTG_03486 [Puccinia graminis f. sp. tritici CRL 75-36-700-3]